MWCRECGPTCCCTPVRRSPGTACRDRCAVPSWARAGAGAVAPVEAGEFEFDSCPHHACVGPMAGVTSASMQVYRVEDATHGGRSFSNLNEGYGKGLRHGG